MTCKQWDIVVVQFPFVESIMTKPRPVLVISNDEFNQTEAHYVATMITTATNTKWSSDTRINKRDITGLQIQSFIRLKLFSLDFKHQPKIIGRLSDEDIKAFKANFKKHLF